MTQDTAARVASYWNDIADKFDSIYSGRKNPVARALDRWLRRDMFERFDWVMRKAGDVSKATVCDIGCGSGRGGGYFRILPYKVTRNLMQRCNADGRPVIFYSTSLGIRPWPAAGASHQIQGISPLYQLAAHGRAI